MIHVTMWTYPWDVLDEGPDRGNALFCGTDPDEVRRAVQATVGEMTDPSMLVAGLNGHNPVDSAELMKELLLAAYEGGARRFSYYNYGMISRRNLGWIGDAVAAARALDAGG